MFRSKEHMSAVVTTSIVILLSSILRLSNGQIINTACTSTIITTFTPCFNYLTGSSSGNNGSSPTEDCCNILKSAMTDSVECACLVITGNVPVSIPFVRSLVLSLPQQCNSGVPVQCKASGVPLPSPGPAILYPPPPRSPTPYYPPRRSPSAFRPAHAPRSQRVLKEAATVPVVKMEKAAATSPPTSVAVEPPSAAAAAPPKPSLLIPEATPARIKPVMEPTASNNSSSYIIYSSPLSLLLLFILAFLNVVFY